MFAFTVHALSGHYRMPGATSFAQSYEIAPVSTLVGFLESACGETGTFEGRFAYGWSRRPLGRGVLLRQCFKQVSNVPGAPKGSPKVTEAMTPTKVETWYDMVYQVAVQGPWEEKLRQGFQGNLPRFGVLSLGESENGILNIREDVLNDTEWLVPGHELALPIQPPNSPLKSGTPDKQYTTLISPQRMFRLSSPMGEIPEEAWIEWPIPNASGEVVKAKGRARRR